MGHHLKNVVDNPPEARQQPPRQDIKPQSKHGVFLWWSDQSPSWVHPDDQEIVDRLVPGNRIFRREECENFADRHMGFSQLTYGNIMFRALPSIWLEVASHGYEIDDFVEIRSMSGKLRPRIATISEIVWNRHSRSIEYELSISGQRIARLYSVDEFQPAIRLGKHLSNRELKLSAQARFV